LLNGIRTSGNVCNKAKGKLSAVPPRSLKFLSGCLTRLEMPGNENNQKALGKEMLLQLFKKFKIFL
jgi:hypothetical protein